MLTQYLQLQQINSYLFRKNVKGVKVCLDKV